MRYRRALFLVDPDKDPGASIALLHRVAPHLAQLLVILPSPTTGSWWARSAPVADAEAITRASLEALREATAGLAPEIAVQVAPTLGIDAVAELCSAEELDLLVFGSRALMSVSIHRKRLPAAVLWTEDGPASGTITQIACVAADASSLAAIGSFLRDHSDRSMQVALLSPNALAPDVVASFLPVSGIEASVEVASPLDPATLSLWINEWTLAREVDLLVFVGSPERALLDQHAGPVLLVPPLAPVRSFGRRAIDIPDLVDEGGAIRARIDFVATLGDLSPVPEQALAFVSGGHVIANALTSAAGEAELPAGLELTSIGVYRVTGPEPIDPLAAVEQRVMVVRPDAAPLVIFDADLPDEALRGLIDFRARRGQPETTLMAVRLRPAHSCRSIRHRLRALGLPPIVLDARAVLDEGEAFDVSDSFDALRLGRVAQHLRRAGFRVEAMVHAGAVEPKVEGFVALRPSDLAAATLPVSSPSPELDPSLGLISGNRIELELHNPTARRWLLEAIAKSSERLHMQVYMAYDDEVGGQVEAELAAAGARGVKVRVLVDSLHGLHGSFGARNPLLERLSVRPGVELRVVRPITELPSLSDLKQRDHRKLVIRDGELALLGGRNLAREYYTGFDEVELTPESPWREVPWLDCGARIEGPAVAALERSFLAAWMEAGGAEFDITTPAAIGDTDARVVVHRGLRDVHTLETYLELIASARSHVYVVNGFPLALELQHALLGALRRGVRVRTLFGRPTPTHSGATFTGPWSTARTAATELVHSRMDPIIAAGGEGYLFACREGVGWAPELGIVNPHVHAKALSVDGQRCTVGSANMDITAAYWESELLLVIEDAAIASGFEAKVDALMAESLRMDAGDPVWQQLAKRRAWMRHWPGVLSV